MAAYLVGPMPQVGKVTAAYCTLLSILLDPQSLCCRRGSDAKAAAMLDGMVLALMLSMNPDGFAAKRRGNGCDAS